MVIVLYTGQKWWELASKQLKNWTADGRWGGVGGQTGQARSA